MLDHIQAVIFDLYGTLIHIHTDEADIPGLWKPLSYFYAYYGARYTPETLMADYRALVEREEQAARQRSGVAAAEINLERVFAALFTRRGVEVSPEVVRCVGQMFRANSTRVAELYPGAQALLEDLRAAGKMVCLLSNAQRVFTELEPIFRDKTPDTITAAIFHIFSPVFIFCFSFSLHLFSFTVYLKIA